MATLSQLEAAFIAADDAGNTEDAQAFAQEIARLRMRPAKQYNTPAPEPVAEPSVGDWAKRQANMFARGGMPGIAGATTGAVAGMPGGPVGMGAGALIGGLGGQMLLKDLTDKMFPTPETTGERAMEAAGAAMTGAGTQLPALGNLAANATNPIVRGAAETMTRGAGAQLAAAAPSAAVGKVVEEKTDSPLFGMLASVATSTGIGALAPRGQSVPIPSTQELRNKATQLYAAADKAGVTIQPKAFDGVVDDLSQTMKKEGFDVGLHPKIAAILTRLESEKGAPKTLSEMDILRRVARGAAGSTDKSERRLAMMAIEKIDDFIGGLKQTDLASGDADVAVPALNAARSTWSKVSKADVLDRLFEKAKNDAGGKYTQAGLEHALRTRFRQIANNDKLFRTFNKDEQEAIQKIVRGSTIQNVLRGVGKLAPHGAISGAVSFGSGAALGGPVGFAAVPMAGLAAEGAATKMGMDRFRNLDEMIKLGMKPPPTPNLLAPMTIRGLLSGS